MCLEQPSPRFSTWGRFLVHFLVREVHRDSSIHFRCSPTSNFFASNLCEKVGRRSSTSRWRNRPLISNAMELRVAKFSGDLNIDHLNSKLFQFGFSNCPVFKWGYVKCTWPIIWIMDQLIRNKMVSICLVFKWSGCPVFKWHSKTRSSFWPFKCWTSLVFRSPSL